MSRLEMYHFAVVLRFCLDAWAARGLVNPVLHRQVTSSTIPRRSINAGRAYKQSADNWTLGTDVLGWRVCNEEKFEKVIVIDKDHPSIHPSTTNYAKTNQRNYYKDQGTGNGPTLLNVQMGIRGVLPMNIGVYVWTSFHLQVSMLLGR
jgi:hypothetical protein